jgi:hypothetical protein
MATPLSDALTAAQRSALAALKEAYVAGKIDGEVTPCEHDWKRVPPVVTTVGDPFAREKGNAVYNAECGRCGKREWLHWPEQK